MNKKESFKSFRENQKITKNEIKVLCSNFLEIKSFIDIIYLLNIEQEQLQEILYPKYEEYSISKKNGGRRIIHVPNTKLLIIQRKLLRLLNAIYLNFILTDRESWSNINRVNTHGFVPSYNEQNKHFRRNIYSNAILHVHSNLILQIDINNFFDSIEIV